MDDEVHDTISRLSDEKRCSNGDIISELVDLYEKGELMRTNVEAEQLNLLRSIKKMMSEVHTNQDISMNVLNTICEINDYANFVSIEEQPSYAFTEAKKHTKERTHREIIRQLEKAKTDGTNE